MFRPAVVLLLAASAPALADTLFLKNGTVLEGKLVSDAGGVYEIRTRFGVQKIPAARVERVERGPSPEEAFEDRWKKLAEGDKDGALALWRFAREKKLRQEEARAAERVLQVDPDNQEVHEALKHVRFQGKWVTPEEAAQLQKDQETASAKARGLVEYQGKWVTKEEKEAREKGLVLKDGKWVTQDEAKAAEGLVLFEGNWIKKETLEGRKEAAEVQAKVGAVLAPFDRPALRLLTDYAAESAEAVVDAAEKALSLHLTKLQPPEGLWPPGQKARLYAFREQPAFHKFVDHFAAQQKLESWWVSLVKTQTGFYYFSITPPVMADWRGPRGEPDTAFSMAHKMGHVAINLLHLHHYTHVPPWLDEGYASWIEDQTLGSVYSFCVSSTYGGAPPRNDKWASSTGWREMVQTLAREKRDRALRELLMLEWNEISYVDLAKARAVVDAIITKNPRDFVRLVGEMKSRFPRFHKWKEMTPRESAERQEQAWKAVFGMDVGSWDQKWREEIAVGK
jgi:hypothetical protein